MYKNFLFLLAMSLLTGTVAAQVPSATWNPNVSSSKYRNPVINADYSDPDVCRVGNDYWMTSSSFACFPGLQILHSTDLVNWELAGAALTDYYPDESWKKSVQHGNFVWAPSIRYHDGWYYIYCGDPDNGLFMTKTQDPRGQWEPIVWVKEGKGLIDCCPLWDEDGKAYLSHGCAGSRAGVKSVLFVAPLSPDGTRVTGPSQIVYDGHETQPTIEGTKFYKRNGYYYIMSPAGGVPTGWQVTLRAKSPFGPYEEYISMAQGGDLNHINGPHQGAWVETQNGEDWFLHFQDKDAYGRVVHLQPMKWVNDWPVIGEDKDGDGVGTPVNEYRKPNLPSSGNFQPAESDEFNTTTLGLQWQWQGPWSHYWYYCDAKNSRLRLYGVENLPGFRNLADCPNLLLQKLPAENFTATAKVKFAPNPEFKARGENAGLIMMGQDYTALKIVDLGDGKFKLQRVNCKKCLKDGKEEVEAEVEIDGVKGEEPYTVKYASVGVGQVKPSARITTPDLWLRVKVRGHRPKGKVVPQTLCRFYYSLDGKNFKELGSEFEAQPGKWIGAKVGLFNCRPGTKNDAAWLDVDNFIFTK